jgi:hypothetical protein
MYALVDPEDRGMVAREQLDRAIIALDGRKSKPVVEIITMEQRLLEKEAAEEMDYSSHSSVSYDGSESVGSYDIEINHPTIQQFSHQLPTPPRKRGRDKSLLKSANEAAAAKLSQRSMAPTPPRRKGRDKTLIKSANEAAAEQILKVMEHSAGGVSGGGGPPLVVSKPSEVVPPTERPKTSKSPARTTTSTSSSASSSPPKTSKSTSSSSSSSSHNKKPSPMKEHRDRTPSEIDLAKAELEEEAIELEAYYQLRRDAEALGITSPRSPSVRPFKVEFEEVERYQSNL